MKKFIPWKPAIITGLVVGIAAVVIFSVADGLNQHFQWGYNPATLRGLTGLLTIVILAIGIYSGMQSVKRSNSDKLTYGQAILCGVVIGVITGLLTAFTGFIYSRFINPGYMAYMVAESQKVMIADGKSPIEIAANTASLQQQMTVGMQTLQAIVGQTVSGIILSLVIGVFIRSKK